MSKIYRSHHAQEDKPLKIAPATHTLPTNKILNLQRTVGNQAAIRMFTPQTKPIQRIVYTTMHDMWNGVIPEVTYNQIKKLVDKDSALSTAYDDLREYLPNMDFTYVAKRQPEADLNAQRAPNTNKFSGLYKINYGRYSELGAPYNDPARFIGAIMHEMMHITAALQYNNHVDSSGGALGHGANMHLPAPTGVAVSDGMSQNQLDDPQQGAIAQQKTMRENWMKLEDFIKEDFKQNLIDKYQRDTLQGRIDYAGFSSPDAHYDTVLVDFVFYLVAQGLNKTQTYSFAHDMLKEANKRRRKGKGVVQKL